MTARIDTGEHPRVFVSYAHDSENHKEHVLEFATFLRKAGIDTRLDRWSEHRRQDWPAWVLRQLDEVAFVLVVASQAYKDRARGGIADAAGLGVQFESAHLSGRLYTNPGVWEPKVLPVVLPGHSVDEIPDFLRPRATSYYVVTEFTEHGARLLLATLRGHRLHRVPELGPDLASTAEPAEASQPRRSPARRTGDPVLEALVDAVAQQWRAEEERRSVADPRPLALSWGVTEQAKAAMADVEPTAVGHAPAQWLAGRLAEIREFVSRMPARRLVVLGAPGAGKTVLAIRLLLDLLDSRYTGDPVPVLFSVAGWNPVEQHLSTWMADRLAQDHPGLRRRTKLIVGKGSKTLAAHLVDTGRIVPILDGLDQIGERLRGEAINAINRLGSAVPLIVTSRATEYVDAVRAAGRGLARAAVVELHPLEPAEVHRYLREATGPATRWRPVLEILDEHPHDPLSQTLRVPLMLWLARTIYADPATEPGELRDRDRFPDRGAIENHLVDHILPALYPGYPTPSVTSTTMSHYDADSAVRWLGFLAGHLHATGTRDLAWWHLQRAVPLVAPGSRFLIGASVGLGVMPVTGAGLGLLLALLLGSLMASSHFFQFEGFRNLDLPHTFQFSRDRIRNDLRMMLVFPFKDGLGLLVVGVVAAIVTNWPTSGFLPNVALAVLLLLGVGHGIWFGVIRAIRRRPAATGIVTVADVDLVSGPLDSLRADRTQALAGTSPFVLLALLCFLVGAPELMTFCLAFALAWLFSSGYFRWVLTTCVLAAGGRLPWKTMTFLDDANTRGVLRQAGGVYQFRHERIQDRLGARPGSRTGWVADEGGRGVADAGEHDRE